MNQRPPIPRRTTQWKPYWHVLKTAAKENATNGRQIGASIALSMFRLFIYAAIYAVAYRFGKVGLTYENVIWSLAIFFAFNINLGIRDVFKLVEREVQSGEIELHLVKPLDWRIVKVCQVLGKNSIEFGLQLVVMPVFLIMVVGIPDISFWSPTLLLGYLLLISFAIISACCLFMTIGLAAFWLNDTMSVSRITERIILIFGGGFVPVALLPQTVQGIVRYSPFGVYAAPTQLFSPGLVTVMSAYIISAGVWTAVLIVLNNMVWRRAQLRIEVNGG